MAKITIFLLVLLSICFQINCHDHHRVRRIVGGIPAEIPPPDDPVVFVKHNGKFARIEGIRNPQDYHYHFRGLRFAQPPMGKLRFQRPKAYTLEGNINATKYPSPCPQPWPRTDSVMGDEDCLFLNVFTPDLPDGTEGLPVVVWIHGGGFRYGSASQYNVQNLVNKRIVLVTIQYRLGSLGFLSTGDRDIPGNAGLFDMAQAVQWTRNYIGFFGGNPYKIVVMGQGTGGSSGLLMCLSSIAKGMTTAAVAMSGTAVSNWAVDNEPKNMAVELADYHGCPTTNVVTMISCLRKLKIGDIIRGDSSIEKLRLTNRGFTSGLSGLLTPSPVSEGRNDGRSLPGFIEKKPMDALEEGDIPNIPLLTGVTRDETGRAVNEQFHQEILSKLGSIPHFLDEVLLGNLQDKIGLSQRNNNSSGITGILGKLNPFDFQGYLSVGKNNIKEAFSKISEATADALFNLPAFLTANLWSKKNNNTFLYRFEHLGQSYKGYHFLQGVPFIGNSSTDENDGLISHGDELAYLFKPQNLDGSPLSMKINETEEDKKVRAIFTDMIYNFVKFGRIQIDNKNAPKFSESDSYIGISSKPKVLKDFRFCQIGLWAGITERLKTNSCKFLSVVGQGVKQVENILFDTVNATGLKDPWKNYYDAGKIPGGLPNPENIPLPVKNPISTGNLPNPGNIPLPGRKPSSSGGNPFGIPRIG